MLIARCFASFPAMKSRSNWLWLIPVFVVYAIGMLVDVIETDAAQYAAMSLEMLRTGNYLEIYHRGADYIDKPPLIFWTSALSFRLFGASNFAYKLPSVLFTLLGLYSTWRLGRLYYGKLAGFAAVFILATCQAWFQFNQDVRTDTILAACTIFSIWQLAAFNQDRKFSHIIWTAVGISGAMLTKGPIGLMVPALAIATDAVLKRRWETFLRWEWLAAATMIAVLLLPMFYGLYTQFDATDGKQTYNGLIKSGVRFYLWTQSFGRITGESTWKNDADPFFFVHTFLWAFLPWSLLFIAGFARKITQVVRQRLLIDRRDEALTIGGILLPGIAFSLSQYKLPHYIFVFFPLAAIVAGSHLSALIRKGQNVRAWTVTQGVIGGLLLLLAAFFCTFIVPLTDIMIALVAAGGVTGFFLFLFRGKTVTRRLLMPAFLAATTLNFIFNANLYPFLTTFEAGNQAGRLAREAGLPLIGYKNLSYGIDFYYRDIVPLVDDLGEIQADYKGQQVMLYTDDESFSQVKATLQVVEDRPLDLFHVSRLSGKFLNPATRSQAVKKMHAVVVQF